MKRSLAILFILALAFSAVAQPTNQAWLNADRIITGHVKSQFLGLNSPPYTPGWVPTIQLDGVTIDWAAPPGGGSVSSVGLSYGSSGFLVSGSPVTSSGTLSLSPTASWGFLRNDNGSTSWTLDVAVNSLVLTNEQRLVEVAWASGPTGAYDMTKPLQTYAISAASAISSLSSPRTSGYANYSEFNITNSSGGDLTMWLTATGITTPDGSRSVVCTNNQATTIKFETSAKGFWAYPIHHF